MWSSKQKQIRAMYVIKNIINFCLAQTKIDGREQVWWHPVPNTQYHKVVSYVSFDAMIMQTEFINNTKFDV